MTARGLRNFNPGNIRHSKTHWMGQAEIQNDDDFVTFDSAKYGIRALYKTLCTYQTKHGLADVRSIINRWAPPNENDTGAYVAAVAKACGVAPGDMVNVVTDHALAAKMVAAIIRHENGEQPYSEQEITTAINLA